MKFLEENNIFSIELDKIDNLNKGDVIVIRSHGVSESILDLLKKKQLTVLNATCPFVTIIQKKVKKYSQEGYHIVILGDKNHPEVIGINGWCENKAIITKDGNFQEGIPQKICVVSQTTEKMKKLGKYIEELKF